MEVLTVGRDNSKIRLDIPLPSNNDSISRLHIELTIGEDGRYYILDQGSANGTFVFKNGQWAEFKQGYIEAETPLRLGEYQTTARQLLSNRTNKNTGPVQEHRKASESRPRRNPETGEILG